MRITLVILTFFLLAAFSASLSAQVVTVDRVNARVTIRLDDHSVNEFSTDSTFAAATHLQLPTAKAVKDYIDAIPTGGADSIHVDQGNIIILYAVDTEISRDTITAGTGDVTGGTNLGGGSEVFKQKTGANLEFRTLVADGGLEAVQTDTTIIIRAVYLFFANDAAAGAGGVPVGNPYKLDLGNSYGMPYGTLRIRIE